MSDRDEIRSEQARTAGRAMGAGCIAVAFLLSALLVAIVIVGGVKLLGYLVAL